MATTPNYGWVMPSPTDLVTDLPADFEVFGDAVDATVDGIDDRVTDLEVITTEGDLIVGNATGDPSRVGIGTAGQVLASDGDTVEWVTPTVSTPTSWTLVNAGGTNLSGNSSITITGLGSYNQLAIWVNNFRSATANVNVRIQFDADTGSNYYTAGFLASPAASYSGNILTRTGQISAVPTDHIVVTQLANTAGSVGQAFVQITGASQASPKMYNIFSGHSNGSSGSGNSPIAGGYWENTSAIDQIRIFTAGGQNFDQGTIRVYGSTN